MNESDPLLGAWCSILERRRAEPAILAETGHVLGTFEDVEDRAAQFGVGLRAFLPGAVIGVQIGNHPDWPSIFLACLRRQLVVVPLDSSISAQERAAALEICRATALIASQPLNGQMLRDQELPVITRLGQQEIDWEDCPPCLLKLTSGTTAAPRAIRFRSNQLIADCNQICETMGISDRDLNFAVIPVSHSYGFSNLLTPLLIHGVSVALSSDRLPRAVIANLDRCGASVFPGTPVFYQAFAAISDIPALEKLRLCISAGAPLSTNVARQFHEKFGLSIHSFYGSSECGGICYDRTGDNAEEGSVGREMEGVKLEPFNWDGKAGQVRVRSAAVGDGYFPAADEEKLGKGVFVPDDLLTQIATGWKVVGRVSDLINVAGKKVNPAEIEAELLAVPGVRQAIVFGRTSSLRHQEVAACVVSNAGLTEIDLLKCCRRRLSGWQVPKRIFMLDELPVNERGKLSRRDLAVRFAGR